MEASENFRRPCSSHAGATLYYSIQLVGIDRLGEGKKGIRCDPSSVNMLQ